MPSVQNLSAFTLPEIAAPATPATGHVALYSTDGKVLLLKDDAGVVRQLSQPSSIGKSSIAAMAAGFASDTYVTDSDLIVPQSRIQAGSVYKLRIVVTKTAASTTTPTLTVRYGTAGTTADTARLTYTFVSAQTAVVDTAEIEVRATFRAVGSGTTAVLSGIMGLRHNLATTGFCTRAGFVSHATSAGFDSTPANSKIGVSMNAGATSSWTVEVVESELLNLAA